MLHNQTINNKVYTVSLSVILALVIIFGYLLFRTILQPGSQGITYELFAALIGFFLTILATSLLLSKQTEAELTKEENIQFLNLKTTIYLELIEQLRDVIIKRQILEEDIIELRLLNQKIAFVASPDVLVAFNEFTRHFAQMSKLENIGARRIDDLLDELSKLSVYIRQDLFNLDNRTLSHQQLKQLILSSNTELDMAATESRPALDEKQT